VTDIAATTRPAHHGEDPAHDHPTDGHYIRIAIILAVLTAIEVALSYVGLEGLGLLVPLFVVMIIKFVLVVLHFMHLKFDSKVLSRVFYAGLLMAIFVYVAALTTFHLFEGK
jgi:cytochrome c oxidase subunit IV